MPEAAMAFGPVPRVARFTDPQWQLPCSIPLRASTARHGGGAARLASQCGSDWNALGSLLRIRPQAWSVRGLADSS